MFESLGSNQTGGQGSSQSEIINNGSLPSRGNLFNGLFPNRGYESNVETCLSNLGQSQISFTPFGESVGTFEPFIRQRLYSNKCQDSCYLLKKSNNDSNDGDDSQPKTILRVIGGRNFLNQFVYENIRVETVNIWLKFSKGGTFSSEINKHFFVQPILGVSSVNSDCYNVHTRYCGPSIEQTLKDFDLYDTYRDICSDWEEKYKTHQKHQRYPYLKFVIRDIAKVMQDRINDDGSFSFYRDLYLLMNFVSSDANSGDINSMNTVIERFSNRVFERAYEDYQEDRKKLFMVILLLKAMYVEDVLRRYGFVYKNFNLSNLSWEFVDSSLSDDKIRNIEISNKVSFNKEKLFDPSRKYKLILRLTGLENISYR